MQAGIRGESVVPPTQGEGGTAFAYAESTSALDLNPSGEDNDDVML